MKFRAIAVGIEEGGHPVQALSNSMEDIHDWAHRTSNKYNCLVDIYETYERKLKRVQPTKDREPK